MLMIQISNECSKKSKMILKTSNFNYSQFNAMLAIRHILWCSEKIQRMYSKMKLSQIKLIQIILLLMLFHFKIFHQMSKKLTTQDFNNIYNFYESNYKTFMTRYFTGQILLQLSQMISLMSETEKELKSSIEKN
jgi:hypothetical protein